MSDHKHKYQPGTPVKHSRYGVGTLASVETEMITPPPFDVVKLDAERWRLRARLAEIDRITERGSAAVPQSVYVAAFGSRKLSVDEVGADALVELHAQQEAP